MTYTWSDKQAEFYTIGWHTRFSIAHGAARSGKTAVGVRRTNSKMAYTRTGQDYAFISTTQKHIDAVLMKETDKWARDCGVTIQRKANNIYHVTSNLGGYNRLITFPATDAGAIGRLKGFEFAEVLIDEVTELPQDMVGMAVSRMSEYNSACTMMTNPKHRLHWFKLDWIDPAEELNDDGSYKYPDVRVWQFNILPECDNPALDAGYPEMLQRTLSGSMLRQLAFSEWTDDGGLIYPLFSSMCIADDGEEPGPIAQYILGVDPAEYSITAVGLWALDNRGIAWLVDEWEYNYEQQGHIPYEQQAEMIHTWVGHRTPSMIVCDWNGNMRTYLEDVFGIMVTPADKQDKQYNTNIVNKMINAQTLRVLPGMFRTIKEAGNYVLDPRQQAKGQWAVLKKNDHFMDELEYVGTALATRKAYGYGR